MSDTNITQNTPDVNNASDNNHSPNNNNDSNHSNYSNYSNDSNILTITNMLQTATFKLQRLEEAKILADYIAAFCPNHNMVAVGILEILVNAIEHGNLQITYSQKDKLQNGEQWLEEIAHRLKLAENSSKFVTVELTKTTSSMILTITDNGSGFDWQQYQTLDPNHLRDLHGRGIFMAKNLAFTELKYNDKGNQAICTIAL